MIETPNHNVRGCTMATWRQNVCPISATQDGVCGCPEFWECKATHRRMPSTTESSTTLPVTEVHIIRSPSPKPSGPPQEKCFFWYHGNCRRGDQCGRAHQSHITWPIPQPPGYVHFEACKLPLCPLRQDFVEMLRSQKQRGPTAQLGGQVDMTGLSQATAIEVTSSDKESVYIDTDNDDDNGNTLLDTASGRIGL
jgi:hypothetical protein